MTKEQLAATLDGREYRNEIAQEEEKSAKEHGLVVVFAYSDDNVELRGAIRDELGAYDGTTVYFTETGLWESKCEDEDCPYAEKERAKCKTIRAVWYAPDSAPWTYETEIPHAKFNIYEDGELFCVGIVFEIAALKEAQSGE